MRMSINSASVEMPQAFKGMTAYNYELALCIKKIGSERRIQIDPRSDIKVRNY